MAAGRHLGKIERLLYLSRGLRDFDEIWYDGAVQPSWASRPLKISKIQDGGGRHLEKSPYLGRGSTDFYAIWHDDAFRTS